jgi:hypothetical protein
MYPNVVVYRDSTGLSVELLGAIRDALRTSQGPLLLRSAIPVQEQPSL